MKNAVNQRLANFIEYLGGRKVEFAGLIGETKYSVNNWLSDTKIPVQSLSNILIAFPELNARWLLTGDGNMISSEESYKKPIVEVQKVAEESPNYGKCSLCIEKDKRIIELEMHRDDLRRQLNYNDSSLGKVLKNGS